MLDYKKTEDMERMKAEAVAIILFTSIAYVKAPPNRAAIITGLLKEPRILRGKAGFKIPFFERVDWLDIMVS